MGTSTLNEFIKSHASSLPEISPEILKCLQVIQCSLIALLILPFACTSTLLILSYRSIIDLYYKLFDQKYKLATSSDSFFAVEKQANRMSINTFVYVKGQPNLHEIRTKFEAALSTPEYFKFKLKLIKKWGFFTWENPNESFNISQHIKYFPGINLLKTYGEQEVLEHVESLLDNQFNLELPQWEFLVFPKVKATNDNGIVCDSANGLECDEEDDYQYAFVYRVYHAYMDGISLIQMLKKIIDGDANENTNKLTIDPVHLSGRIKKPTALEWIFHYLQVILLGPHTIYKTTKVDNQNTFQSMTTNKGPKFLGCTKATNTMESIKQIRRAFKCSTTAIFNSAVTGALRKAAIRKGEKIPEYVDFGFTSAMLPYPDDSPQNRFTINLMKSPISKVDRMERLELMNESMKSLAPHEISTLYWLGKVVGFYPYLVTEMMYDRMHTGYVLTNLPGFSEEIKLDGKGVVDMYGCPPISSGAGFGIGVNSYIGKFRTCWVVEKSHLIETRSDMQDLITDYEKELILLEYIARATNNNLE